MDTPTVWTETIEATPAYYLEVTGPYGTARHKEAMEYVKAIAFHNFEDDNFTIYGLALDDPLTVDEELLRYRVCLLCSELSLDQENQGELGMMRIPSHHVLVVEVDHTREAIAQMWEKMPLILAEQEVSQTGFVAERFRRSKVAAGKSEFLIQLP